MRHALAECCVESQGINALETGMIWSEKKNASVFLNFHLEVYEMPISFISCLSSVWLDSSRCA